jgi:ubiquinone/menaquinone biosynthesis C-methylase UbiE
VKVVAEVAPMGEGGKSARKANSMTPPSTPKANQLDLLRNLASITEKDAVLDVWCGSGELTAQIATVAGRVVGTDHSANLITAAKARFPSAEFAVSDPIVLPFRDAEFDVVVCNLAAHHFASPDRNFAEARRVLVSDGGRFAVTIPIHSKRVALHIILDVAREHFDLPEKVLKGGPFHDLEDASTVVAAMRAAGFGTAEGHEQTSYTVLESIDGLFNYAWRKMARPDGSDTLREPILAKSLQRLDAYRQADGLYRFPDQIMVARGQV